jgi:REP element-mobilizing transposase RayT
MSTIPKVHIPLAYHITFGTCGTRLHGDERPHVDMDHNEYGTPFPPTDPYREDEARARMREEPCYLTIDQRKEVERAIRDLCKRYGWTVYAIAVQSDHTHVVLTADREGDQLRDALKAVATKWLNKKFERRTWWAEGGSAKYIWTDDRLESATKYVNDQRDF